MQTHDTSGKNRSGSKGQRDTPPAPIGAMPAAGNNIFTLVDPMINTVVNGYTITSEIGRGGMGIVYLGENEQDSTQKAAIKVLLTSGDEDAINRFIREALHGARINHPNIVETMNAGIVQNRFYILMEYVDGRNLNDVLTDLNGEIEISRAVRILMQICDGMQAAHDLGILHRDLKPKNIMVLHEPPDFVKIVDLGIARAFGPRWAGADKITQTGLIVGTVDYLAPELVPEPNLVKPFDYRVDIYATGMILYTLLTGAHPFNEQGSKNTGGLLEVMRRQLEEVPAPPHEIAIRNIPEGISRIAMHALEKDPNARFQSMREFHDALTPYSGKTGIEIISAESDNARRETDAKLVAPQLEERQQKSRLKLPLILGISFAAIIAGAGLIFALARHNDSTATTTQNAATQELIRPKNRPPESEEAGSGRRVEPELPQDRTEIELRAERPGTVFFRKYKPGDLELSSQFAELDISEYLEEREKILDIYCAKGDILMVLTDTALHVLGIVEEEGVETFGIEPIISGISCIDSGEYDNPETNVVDAKIQRDKTKDWDELIIASVTNDGAVQVSRITLDTWNQEKYDREFFNIGLQQRGAWSAWPTSEDFAGARIWIVNGNEIIVCPFGNKGANVNNTYYIDRSDAKDPITGLGWAGRGIKNIIHLGEINDRSSEGGWYAKATCEMDGGKIRKIPLALQPDKFQKKRESP